MNTPSLSQAYSLQNPQPTPRANPGKPQSSEPTDTFTAGNSTGYVLADIGLVAGAVAVCAAPAVAGAAFGLAGIAAALGGGVALDYFSKTGEDGAHSAAVTLPVLAAVGAVLGGPGIAVASAIVGTCGLFLSIADAS